MTMRRIRRNPAWFRGRSVEPGEGDANPEGVYTRNESGRTETCAGNTLLARERARRQGERLDERGFGQGVRSGTCWTDGYQQNRRTKWDERILVGKTYDFRTRDCT